MSNDIKKNELTETEMDSVAGGASFFVSSNEYEEAMKETMKEIMKQQEENHKVNSISFGNW